MFIVIAVRHKYAFRADADDAGFFDTVKLLGRVRFRSGEDRWRKRLQHPKRQKAVCGAERKIGCGCS